MSFVMSCRNAEKPTEKRVKKDRSSSLEKKPNLSYKDIEEQFVTSRITSNAVFDKLFGQIRKYKVGKRTSRSFLLCVQGIR
jgi:hypothetical protein